ncbi:ABC transporter permease [Limimaricola pyoseonensis]|uniref:Iron(III) transport system permease protein n=1 Tax=Limimaricola pyoseonensis TaxID=521013 RepID=A0A1G6ZNX6_9RHOB|nr:iron ABC transporter permease [Limimaricola pyoseonensis]SDE03907.1 iron(III) transport system permease protein [Limimaricola pyoseonensis]
MRPRWPDPWSLGAVAIAALVLLPVLSVIWLAFRPEDNIWPHLLSTTLPRYLGNTLLLMSTVGAITALVGAGAGWLVVMYRFPGHGWLQWALLLPLAVPAYVGAYALVDFLEYAGPVQTGLRQLMGWQDARDYVFPQIRSRGAAVLVLSAALYPYVYLLARAAFREQSGAGFEVARALGVGPWGRFWRVGLPLARPAIAAGCAVVMMETVNDFGVVDYFAVQTLTTGIFTVWLQAGNLGGAAQLATLVLGVIVLLVTLEKLSRRRSRFFGSARQPRPVEPVRLTGWQGAAACAACLVPFGLGFVLPVAVLSGHALDAAEWAAPGLIRALTHTLATGGAAALATVVLGLFMVYGARLSGKRLPVLLLPVTAIGYAAPGAVLGVGILFPLAGLDNAVADGWVALGGADPGLILTGSAAALVIAYTVRFFAIAQGAADAALGRVAPSLPMAARSLGQTAGGTLRRVHLPLIRASIGSALLLVFVDCVKELPATLLLRPFGYDTLATRVHAKASLENIAEAAPAALMITLVGLVAVGFLARANR